MEFSSTRIPYRDTGFFTDIIGDYLEGNTALSPFYRHPVSLAGLKEAMEERDRFATPRKILVDALRRQYQDVSITPELAANMEKLLLPNCYSITTAHQPALFTGTLYFIYKILHAIKLAERLKLEFPDREFVPVYWMGSEDADFDELGKFYLNGEKISWTTSQTGAFGKMQNKGLEPLLNRIEGELIVQPHGRELLQLLRESYTPNTDIQTATFRLLHALFSRYGLLVIIPDTADVKQVMVPVFADDLFNRQPSQIVSQTVARLSEHYKIQANPRNINLFYFREGIRERIQELPDRQGFFAGEFRFTPSEMRAELEQHPERFSPNVILRGLYQASLLPDIAFIGGGGETAYWFELADLFRHYNVPFPTLVLRNSFLVIEKAWSEKIRKLDLQPADTFMSEQQLLGKLVARNRNGQLQLKQELEATRNLYSDLGDKAGRIDPSLRQHVEALQARALRPLEELEKKMLRAEKRKFSAEERQILQIRQHLFPHNGLQERIENFMPFYARWGNSFIDQVYRHSLTLEQQFVILEEK